MSVIYWLLPAIIIVGVIAVFVLFWSIKTGQYEDLEGPPSRILMDDDDPNLPWHKKKDSDREDK